VFARRGCYDRSFPFSGCGRPKGGLDHEILALPDSHGVTGWIDSHPEFRRFTWRGTYGLRCLPGTERCGTHCALRTSVGIPDGDAVARNVGGDLGEITLFAH
jgi:hypothetical protein